MHRVKNKESESAIAKINIQKRELIISNVSLTVFLNMAASSQMSFGLCSRVPFTSRHARINFLIDRVLLYFEKINSNYIFSLRHSFTCTGLWLRVKKNKKNSIDGERRRLAVKLRAPLPGRPRRGLDQRVSVSESVRERKREAARIAKEG